VDLLTFILVAYGMTQIIVYGSIFNRIRPAKQSLAGLGELFHCSMCMGFHCGWFIFLLFHISGVTLWNNVAIGMFMFGCISSGTSYLIDKLVDDNGLSVGLKKQ